jgi:hypothetical protein
MRWKNRESIADAAKELTLGQISSVLQIRTTQVGSHEPGARQIRLVEAGIAQVGIGEVCMIKSSVR